MKSHARYKGDTNNNSVIIFLRSQKLPAMVERTYSEVFVIIVVVLHFTFDLHFVVVSSFVDDLHFDVVSSHCFSTSSLTLPWTIAGVLTPHFIFSVQPIAE